MDITNNMDFIQMFENKLCQYTGFKHSVTVDCCTNGILISLEMLRRIGKIDKSNQLIIPYRTYMSVPMTLKNNGWNILFDDIRWFGKYEIGNTKVFDAATDFKENMNNDYSDDSIVCVSFQQKKRLSLGRGGVILFNDDSYEKVLKRLRYDGRNHYVSDRDEMRDNPDDIICGYHCYMEPDKAAEGVLKMNQIQTLREYLVHSFSEYEDLTKLKIW